MMRIWILRNGSKRIVVLTKRDERYRGLAKKITCGLFLAMTWRGSIYAALKRDDPSRSIEFVYFGGTGSEVGRCQAAGINLIRGKAEFVKRYSEQKNKQAFSAVREKVSSPVESSDKELSSLRAAEPSVSDFEEVSQGEYGNSFEPKPESASAKIFGCCRLKDRKINSVWFCCFGSEWKWWRG